MKARATRKDVLYALQYGHEKLIKTFVPGGGRNPDEYSLSGSGVTVERKVARELLNDPHLVPADEGLFPGSAQSYEWREVA
jgi:hypothetical protein